MATIGIALICEDGHAAIAVADRSTYLREGNLLFSGSECKIAAIAPQALLLNAGNWPDSAFIARVKSEMGDNPTIPRVAKSVDAAREERRRQRIEEEITGKLLGMSFADFASAATSRATSGIMQDIYGKIANFSFDICFLVIGIDTAGAHLFGIEESGVNDLSKTGFGAIGAGASLARGVIVQREFTKRMTLAEAAYVAYEAKKVSEYSLVDKNTDMMILRPGEGPMTVSAAIIAEMEAVYQRLRPKLARQDVKQIQDMLAQAGKSHAVTPVGGPSAG